MWRSCRGCSWIHDCHCILLALKYINLKLIEAWICLLLITPTQEKQTRAFIPEMKYFHLRCCNAQPSSSVSLFVLGKTFGKLSSFRSPLLFFLACKLRSKHHFLAFLCRGEGRGGGKRGNLVRDNLLLRSTLRNGRFASVEKEENASKLIRE